MPNLDTLNADRVEQALKYLAQTDVNHAELSGRVKQLEELLKSVKAKEYLNATGTDGNRTSVALSSQTYIDAVNEWSEAVIAFKTVDNLRNREMLIVDLFRTLEASRRKGNL